jgi:hypothetical protein
MSGFFEEVKRRKVYRVAATYIIAAGFVIQIGSAVFSGMGIAKLDAAFCRCALAGRVSDRADPCVGL